MKKEKKIKEYKIKVPVSATEKVLANFTYEDAISRLEKDIEIYNENNEIRRVAFRKSNKTQQKVIQKIDTFRYQIGEDSDAIPALLLKVTTYNTNLLDGYTEEPDGSIKVFGTQTKLGSEKNYMLFYPNFVGITPNIQANWLVFTYIDTNKNDSEMVNTAKLVISSVLNLKHVQVTREDILKKIKKASVPIFQVRYTGIINDTNGVKDEYLKYLIESKLKRDKSETFENIPFELAQNLLSEDSQLNEYQVREAKFVYGKSEYKLIKKLFKSIPEEYNEFDILVEEARNIYEEAAEHTFTDHFVLFEDEMGKMYNQDFIVEKLSPIITNYIVSYDV